MAKKLGTNTLLVPKPKSWRGPVSPGPYGCCAYAPEKNTADAHGGGATGLERKRDEHIPKLLWARLSLTFSH